MLIITVGGNEVTVAPGEQFFFGRDAGPGQLTPDDRRISGQHGVIAVAEQGWSVSSTASFFGFSVYDCESPSRLHVPLGAGPVPVPFAWAVISIDIKGGRVSGGTVESSHDHRCAMSFAVLGLVASTPIMIRDAEYIATSYPGFTSDMAKLGANMQVAESL